MKCHVKQQTNKDTEIYYSRIQNKPIWNDDDESLKQQKIDYNLNRYNIQMTLLNLFKQLLINNK